jgi:hypothetical protein
MCLPWRRLCVAELCVTLSTTQELEDQVSGKRKLLLGLSAQLVNVRKATAPLQSHLGVTVTEQTKQKALAKLLPAPLYIVYSQLVAVMDAFAAPIQVSENEPWEMHPLSHTPCSDEKVAKRIVTLGISGGRWLTRPFRDARRFPSTRL